MSQHLSPYNMASLGLWTLPFCSLVRISPTVDSVNLQSGLNAAQIFAVGVGVTMPFLLLLVLLLHYGEGKCCRNFRRCRRYDTVFTAVDAAITLRRG